MNTLVVSLSGTQGDPFNAYLCRHGNKGRGAQPIVNLEEAKGSASLLGSPEISCGWQYARWSQMGSPTEMKFSGIVHACHSLILML